MGRSAAAALAAVLLLAAPANAYYIFTYSDAKCTQAAWNIFGDFDACKELILGPLGGSITVSASGLVKHWASGDCSGNPSQAQVSATCSPFFGKYAVLAPPSSPSPSPAPSGGGGSSGSSGFYAFLLVPAVLALIAARCFCCPLDRRVTGLPVRSRRHRHDLRYTVSADECGDCLNSINKATNSSTDGRSSGYYQVGSGPVYTCVRSEGAAPPPLSPLGQGLSPPHSTQLHTLHTHTHLPPPLSPPPGSRTCAAPRAGSRRGGPTLAASARTTASARGAFRQWAGARRLQSTLCRPAPNTSPCCPPLRRPALQAAQRPCSTTPATLAIPPTKAQPLHRGTQRRSHSAPLGSPIFHAHIYYYFCN